MKNIGKPGNNSGIKEVSGNVADAEKLFRNQVDPSTIIDVGNGILVVQGSDGVIYTFRSSSSALSDFVPTIDVNGIDGLRKIKFIP